MDQFKAFIELKHASESKLIILQTENKKPEKGAGQYGKFRQDKANATKPKTEMDFAIVIQQVFQNVILGSEVNWAAEPALRETVLQLEKALTTI
ncbi:centromere protein H-like [Cavia porcellus]|uniref:centromere protein H-like n=1 Tax=Cavia porcellus TaxID=10141 RepID=UPI000661C2BC|nr:centromere protein H-like [Cavia porcellus]